MSTNLSRWLLVAGLAPILAAAVVPERFRWFAPLEWEADARPRETVVAGELTSEVYAGARSDFADIRVFDDRDEEVPCLIKRRTQARKRLRQNECPLTLVEFNERPDNVFEIVLARDAAHPPPARLVVETPLKNFEKRVAVFGADVKGDWRPLVVGEAIFDYTRFIDVRETTVSFPARPHAWYMVRVDNVSDIETSASVEITRQIGDDAIVESARGMLQRRDFRIDRLRFFSFVSETVAEAPVRREYPVNAFSATEERREQRTVIDFHTNGEPLLEVAIETGSRNFHRPVELHVRNPQSPVGWRTLARGRFSELSLATRERRELSLELPEARGSHYRLLIDNGDSPPLDIDDVIVLGAVYRVAFIAHPDRQYRLYFGNERLAAPRYDLAAVIANLDETVEPLELSLGVVAPNPALHAGLFFDGGFLGSRAALVGIGVLIVAILGWAIVYSAKKIDSVT